MQQENDPRLNPEAKPQTLGFVDYCLVPYLLFHDGP